MFYNRDTTNIGVQTFYIHACYALHTFINFVAKKHD